MQSDGKKMGSPAPLRNDLRRPVFTRDGELLMTSRDLCIHMRCTQERARAVLRDLDVYSTYGNVNLYRKTQVVEHFAEVAPRASGLVPKKYIVSRSGIGQHAFNNMLPLLPNPRVTRVASDGRKFMYWKKEDADNAVKKIIRIYNPRKRQTRK